MFINISHSSSVKRYTISIISMNIHSVCAPVVTLQCVNFLDSHIIGFHHIFYNVDFKN